MTPFERYREIIDDWPAFRDALARPPRPTVLANALRLDAEELVRWLALEDIAAEPIPWLPGALRLAAGSRPGWSVPFLTGLLNIQEASAMLPVTLLDPQPGERVLDLCAAPGNKTAQIAFAMGDRGAVVANDRFANRVGLVRRTVERLGLSSVAVTRFDGTSLPRSFGRFDRVLVDVPCSCEGTSRKHPSILTRLQMREPGRGYGNQRALLDKAIQLCRPGGRVVYATCTYAPEENEAVVAAILADHGENLRLLAPERPAGLRIAPGLRRWQGQTFPTALTRSWRIYPHHNDTGGFYVAVLEKLAPTHRGEPEQPPADVLSGVDPETYLEQLERAYGLGRELFAGHRLLEASRERLALAARDAAVATPPTIAIGYHFLHRGSAVPRLTTSAVCALGRHATRGTVELEPRQVDASLIPEPIAVGDEQLRDCSPGRPVIVRHRGQGLGFGELGRAAGGWVLRSTFPHRWYAERARRGTGDQRSASSSA